MSVNRKFMLYACAGCLICSAAGAALFVWAKSPYHQAPAVEVAQAFLEKLRNKNLAAAYALTVQSGYAGRSLGEFRELVENESPLCWSAQFAGTHPPQTNGNRLRRWLRGEAMDMEQVNIEFQKIPCLLSVRLLRTQNSDWKVFYFASHAG